MQVWDIFSALPWVACLVLCAQHCEGHTKIGGGSKGRCEGQLASNAPASEIEGSGKGCEVLACCFQDIKPSFLHTSELGIGTCQGTNPGSRKARKATTQSV